MNKLLQSIIRKVKKEDYALDERIPASYLISLTLKKAFMVLRGKLSGISNQGMLFVSSSSVIKARTLIKVGRGCTFDDRVYIDAVSSGGIVFGNNVSVGKRTSIECTGSLRTLGKGIVVGDNVGLGTDSFYGCAGGIKIGDDTIIGNYVSMHAENHNYTDPEVPIRLQGVNQKGIIIGKNCWIGAKVTILDGVVLKDGCIISAGAVVRQGVYEPNNIYGGVPAKLLKSRI